MKRVGGRPMPPLREAEWGGRGNVGESARTLATERLGRPSPAWSVSGHALLRDASRLGGSPTALERAETVLRGGGVTIVAGQQPGLLGGPLYTLYKALGAMAFARWLERAAEVPVLPVFWSVGDDSDFGEVASTWIPSGGAKPKKLRDEETPPGGTCVGGLELARQRTAFETLRDETAGLPGAPALASRIDGALQRSRTWGEFFCALLYALLPECPLFCIDGADPAWLDPAQDWLRERAASPDLARELDEGAARARALGIEPSFSSDLAERALFRLIDGVREPAPAGGHDSTRIAPNVILRPLLQDWLLPNVATVCGPSEIAYRVQLGPVYAGAGVPEPLRLARMPLLLFPPQLLRSIRSDGDYEALVRDPRVWSEAMTERELPAPLLDRISELRSRFGRELQDLDRALSEYDPSLTQLVESSAGKIDFQVGRIQEGVVNKARHRAARSHPALPWIQDFIAPREREQERVLGSVTPFLYETGAGGDLEDAAARWAERLATDGTTETAWYQIEEAPDESEAS